jgi:hypothetical protein
MKHIDTSNPSLGTQIAVDHMGYLWYRRSDESGHWNPWQKSASDGDLAAHKAEKVTDADGAHGLKVESGTFTPTFSGQTTAGETTYTIQQGRYYRIGNLVHFTIQLNVNSFTGTGRALIGGLPFTSYNNGLTNGVDISAMDNINYPTDAKEIKMLIFSNSNFITAIWIRNSNVSSIVNINDFIPPFEVRLSGMYRIN